MLVAPAAPVRAAGASLYLTPGSGTYTIGSNFTVTVKASTGGNAINAAEGSISFDKNILSVVSVSKGGSIFPFWTTEPTGAGAANSSGNVSFGGGLPPPGYNGSSGKLISIVFKGRAVGKAQVRFTSGSILANDGKGTNVLETMGTGSYTVAAKEEPAKETATPAKPAAKPSTAQPEPVKEVVIDEEYNKPSISSPTHPDQNAWYKENKVEFLWSLPASVTGVSLAFNKEATTDPGTVADGLYSAKTFENVENGIWYLHLRFNDDKKWGTADHYRVMIDGANPLPFAIDVIQKESSNWPKLAFKAVDQLSGVQLYEVYINSLEEKQFSLPEDAAQDKLNVQLSKLEYGEHTALVRVVDRAGNETISTAKFEVQPIETPVIKNYAEEIRSTDNFFISGTALENITVRVFIQDKNGKTVTREATSDKNGKWFHLYDGELENGRYVAWVQGENVNGLKSLTSEKVSFLVTPPVFARLGSFVINYFTVIVSLLFMIILIVLLLLYLIGLARKKLKKETIEVEDVLRENMTALKQTVEAEIERLNKVKKASDLARESEKTRQVLSDSIEMTEKKIYREIKDVEDILK